MALVQTPIVVAATFLLVTTASAQDSTKTKSRGATRRGKYLTESEAAAAGNKPAAARKCDNR